MKPSVAGVRDGQDGEISARKQGVKPVGRVQLIDPRRGSIAADIRRKDSHAECFRKPRHLAADPAHSDDEHAGFRQMDHTGIFRAGLHSRRNCCGM